MVAGSANRGRERLNCTALYLLWWLVGTSAVLCKVAAHGLGVVQQLKSDTAARDHLACDSFSVDDAWHGELLLF